MPGQFNFELSILIRHEVIANASGWVAQCLEYDIAAQGDTISEAMASFRRTFLGQVRVDVAHGRKPLEGIQKAPAEYWAEFSRAEQLMPNTTPFSVPEYTPEPYMIQAVAQDCRVR